MKSRKVLFGLVCVLLLAVMLPAVSMAATIDVDSYEDFHAALFKANSGANPAPVVINITGDFKVDRSLNPDWHYWWALPAGSTINGNNHTISFINLYNLGNGNYLYKSMGNTTVKDLTIDASNITVGGFGLICADGDKLENVTIKGAGKLTHAVSASGTVTVTDCHFSDVKHSGIYNEDSTVVKVTGTTFENCKEYGVIIRGNGSVFSNNTVTNANVNARGTNITLTNNTFNGKNRIKFYTEDNVKEFSGNKINDESYIVTETAAKNTDLSNNIYENIYTALASDTISDNAKAAAIAAHIARNQPAELKNRTPQTGDNSNIALWLSLMAISALSFVALGRKSRFN